MGGELDVLQQWRKDITAGRMLGPRIVMSGPMLDGPQPRFPSSIAIKTPEDGRRAVDDLKEKGADFIKLQSLIPREAVFAIADEAKKQGITFVGHVPDSVRASEMSNAGQKSFEHLIGIFEGASPLEDEFIKGSKSESKFLSTYDPKRAATLFALLAKNQTWQCPTLVWERGGNLIDQTDFAHDGRAKYVPASWKDGTWKRFTEQIMHDFNIDDLATRKHFRRKRIGSRERDAQALAFHFSPGQTRRRASTSSPASACTKSCSASSPRDSPRWRRCKRRRSIRQSFSAKKLTWGQSNRASTPTWFCLMRIRWKTSATRRRSRQLS